MIASTRCRSQFGKQLGFFSSCGLADQRQPGLGPGEEALEAVPREAFAGGHGGPGAGPVGGRGRLAGGAGWRAGPVGGRGRLAGGAGWRAGPVGGRVLQHLLCLLAFAVQLRVGQAGPGDGAVAGADEHQLTNNPRVTRLSGR